MFLSKVFCILGVIGMFYSPWASPAKADGPTVVINELLWMGSSASSADEWIELRNLTDQPVDLSNWQLTKKSSGAEVAMLTIPMGKVIAPNGQFLISNYSSTNTASTLNVVSDLVTTDVALSNSALQIKLYDASHIIMDVADDGVGNPLSGNFDSSKKVFVSMERNPNPGDGTIATNWHSASTSLGFKDGAPELGTPGITNSNGLPAAQAGADQNTQVGQMVNFDGSDSTDPENQPLTFSWDFGDGGAASDATPTHVYVAAGSYVVTLTVSDGLDANSDSLLVTVSPADVVQSETAPVTPLGPGVPSSCHGLMLSEIFPNPSGIDTDEFIEIQNTTTADILVGKCSVATSTTKNFSLPAGIHVPAGGWLNLPKSQTHLSLTNAGGTILLLDSDGTELDRTTYPTAPEGKSWAKVGGAWLWTEAPTPGATNIEKVTPSTSTTKKSSSTKKTGNKKIAVAAQSVSIADVQQLDSGDRVIVQGLVTTMLGSLGSQLAFIQDGQAGVTMVVPNGEPVITIGDVVKIEGTVRLYQGRRRVAVAAHGLSLVGIQDVIPIEVATDDVSADQADLLVHTKGIVALASGLGIEIDDGSGPVTIYLKSSTGIVRPKVKAGDTVDVIGIVNVATSGIRILPRQQSDLHVEKVLGATSVAAPVTLPPANQQQSWWYWVMAGLGGLGAAARPLWRAWRGQK